jgi:hypothetical protein
MANRSRTTFQKRQKELARAEKQREKFAKRMQRKAEKRRLTDGPALSQEAAAPLPHADHLT